jgi:hypothetical protein
MLSGTKEQGRADLSEREWREGRVGQIRHGQYAGWYLEVVRDRTRTGWSIYLTKEYPGTVGEGYDIWADDEDQVDVWLRDPDFEVAWLSETTLPTTGISEASDPGRRIWVRNRLAEIQSKVRYGSRRLRRTLRWR